MPRAEVTGLTRAMVPVAAILVHLLHPGPALCATAPGDEKDVTAIRQVLEKFDRSYEAANVDAIAQLVSPDGEAVFYMTDVGDRWNGLPAIRAGLGTDFKRMKSAKIEGQPATVHLRGNLAWFERLLVLNIVVKEGEMAIFSRATGVLEKKNGQWLLVQLHMSVGAPRDAPARD